jgi:glycerol-3-phosphate acyltransferase PlsX
MTTNEQLPIAVDVMGGDHGPQVVIEGALGAAEEFGIRSLLVGDRTEIEAKLRALGASSNNLLSIHHAPNVVGMEDSPSVVIRGKTDSSVRQSFDVIIQGKASAMISPGNTGAVMAAGLVTSGTLPGIARPAIATLIPKVGAATPTILLDCGANIDCHAYQLVQFALMGSYYARVAIASENPRVALLSNGTELSKGTDVIRSAAQSLVDIEGLNFIGYVEGRDLPRDVADVVVCDGFIGNIVLKAMEGTVELVLDSMKHSVERSIRGKVGLALAKPLLKAMFREKLDPSSYGGAPLLGLRHVAVICHGSSSARAIKNGVRAAQKFVDAGLVGHLEQSLACIDVKLPGVYEDGIWDRMGKRFEKKRVEREKNERK